MTALAWIAVLGPILAGATGLGVGFAMGIAHGADAVGAMGERCNELEAAVNSMRARLAAGAMAPADRGESRRVLDLVAPRGSA